jgi:hypothetical protein
VFVTVFEGSGVLHRAQRSSDWTANSSKIKLATLARRLQYFLRHFAGAIWQSGLTPVRG